MHPRIKVSSIYIKVLVKIEMVASWSQYDNNKVASTLVVRQNLERSSTYASAQVECRQHIPQSCREMELVAGWPNGRRNNFAGLFKSQWCKRMSFASGQHRDAMGKLIFRSRCPFISKSWLCVIGV